MNGTIRVPRLLLTASIGAVFAAGIFTTAHAQSAADGKVTEPSTAASPAPSDAGKSRRERRAEENAKRKAAELTKTPVPGPEATKTPTAAADGPDKQICRTQKVTGSNFSKRSCATAAQWAAFDKHYEEDARESARRRQGQPVTAE